MMEMEKKRKTVTSKKETMRKWTRETLQRKKARVADPIDGPPIFWLGGHILLIMLSGKITGMKDLMLKNWVCNMQNYKCLQCLLVHMEP
ncbi:hypothetical protein OROHE_001025 [Orobanche hederae]